MREEISWINGSIFTWLNIESIIENLNELEKLMFAEKFASESLITSDVTDSYSLVMKRVEKRKKFAWIFL